MQPRYKARLVARGFSQKQSFDYTETYSPVAHQDIVRMVLALANRKDMYVGQKDIKTAFLNGKLTEEIYVQQPEGFEKGEGLVCRLNRSLYGLKQASRKWNERCDEFVQRLGFIRNVNTFSVMAVPRDFPCTFPCAGGGPLELLEPFCKELI